MLAGIYDRMKCWITANKQEVDHPKYKMTLPASDDKHFAIQQRPATCNEELLYDVKTIPCQYSLIYAKRAIKYFARLWQSSF